jgi:hypothetical protein
MDKYIFIYIFFCKYLHIRHRNTHFQYKQTCSCTQMFALCGNRTCELLRSRRVFPPLRQIGRLNNSHVLTYFYNVDSCWCLQRSLHGCVSRQEWRRTTNRSTRSIPCRRWLSSSGCPHHGAVQAGERNLI